MSRLCIFTIVLNGQPWIRHHLPMLAKLRVPWRWVIVHGYAKPVADTAWCKDITPPPDDGTRDYIASLMSQPEIDMISNDEPWEGKTQMVNFALGTMLQEPCVLMQIDADEIWETWQLERIVEDFSASTYDAMAFRSRCWTGPKRTAFGFGTWGNMTEYEWVRAWRWDGRSRFTTHEPPMLQHCRSYRAQDDALNESGLMFEHMAYATREQVRFKERYYGYSGLETQWYELNARRGAFHVGKGAFANNQRPFLSLETEMPKHIAQLLNPNQR